MVAEARHAERIERHVREVYGVQLVLRHVPRAARHFQRDPHTTRICGRLFRWERALHEYNARDHAREPKRPKERYLLQTWLIESKAPNPMRILTQLRPVSKQCLQS